MALESSVEELKSPHTLLSFLQARNAFQRHWGNPMFHFTWFRLSHTKNRWDKLGKGPPSQPGTIWDSFV